MFLCWTAFRVNPGAHTQPSCFRLDIPYLGLKLSSYCLFFVSSILLVCFAFCAIFKIPFSSNNFFCYTFLILLVTFQLLLYNQTKTSLFKTITDLFVIQTLYSGLPSGRSTRSSFVQRDGRVLASLTQRP